MSAAPQLQNDPTERGLRILAEMLEEATERRRLRLVDVGEEGNDDD